MKKQNGITLIALVITIIVLLILAGVTINLTIGERGIFTAAQTSGEKQKISEYLEKVELARATVAAENMGSVPIEKLVEQLYKDNIVPAGSIKQINEDEIQMVTAEGYQFKLTKDGTEYIDKTEISNVITYIANNETDMSSTQTAGATATLKTNEFTAPDGKHFSSWNTASDGSGTSYAANTTLNLDGNITLYAIWESHSYTSEVITAATCTTSGTRKYTCSSCGDTYTETINATNHSYTSEVITAATCTSSGTKKYTCSDCGDTYTETVSATGHSYTSSWTKYNSCTSSGTKQYTCKNCSDSYSETVAKIGRKSRLFLHK